MESLLLLLQATVKGIFPLNNDLTRHRIISGGAEGEVRVWKIGKQTQSLEVSLKEHRGRVWSIKIRAGDEQAVSASGDGSCILWDLKHFTRHLALFESTLFKQVLYSPDGSQILTTGSNRKVILM